MSNVHAVSTAQAINLLILAHLSQNLDRIATSYGNLEWALAQDDTESCTCRIAAEKWIRKNGEWITKDSQAVKVGSIQTLWMVMALTGEITRFTGRVDMKGNLFEIVGAEGEDIVPTFPINELYFWRVNLLKDELAAQSTSTAVEVEYSDNAEMEVETSPEYD